MSLVTSVLSLFRAAISQEVKIEDIVVSDLFSAPLAYIDFAPLPTRVQSRPCIAYVRIVRPGHDLRRLALVAQKVRNELEHPIEMFVAKAPAFYIPIEH